MFIEKITSEELAVFWDNAIPNSDSDIQLMSRNIKLIENEKYGKGYEIKAHYMIDRHDQWTETSQVYDFEITGFQLVKKNDTLPKLHKFLSDKFGKKYDKALKIHMDEKEAQEEILEI